MNADRWPTTSGTLITVAPTGAETAKADWPQLPTTLEELVAQAKECEAAGAALVHVHVRDDEHRPTLDLGRLKATVQALREETDLVVQLSTGGSVHDPLESRLRVLEAEPDSCSLTCGTVNFGPDVFLNPWSLMVDLYRQAQEREVVPEFELFDLGQVWSLRRLLDECGLPYGGTVHVDFVTGVPGGMPGTAAALVAGVQALPAEVTSWSATGIGRAHLPVMAATLAMGGHLRVGMEDNLMYGRGRPVTGNAELVTRAARLAEELQRPPLTADEARTLLGTKDRRQGAASG
ncbi:beta-keto acid cleavage family enzyme [Thalassiella azotivora]